MSTESEDGVNDSLPIDLPDSDGFWRLLLGRQYDNLEQSEKSGSNLLNVYYRQESEVADRIHTSKDGLISALQSEGNNPETILETIWAESNWQKKTTGSEIQVDESIDTAETLESIRGDNYIVECLNEDLYIVSSRRQVSRSKGQKNNIRRILDEDWTTLFLKEVGDNVLEIRGPKRQRKQLANVLASEKGLQKIQRDLSEESVLDNLASIFGAELRSLDIVEIKFKRTHLPDASEITLRNTSGISTDLGDKSLKPKIVSPNLVSQIEYVKFKDENTDNIAKLVVDREARGFTFNLQTNYISEDIADQIKSVIRDKFDVKFDKVYPYSHQHQSDYILQQILTGSVEAYDQYYENLDSEEKGLISDFIDIKEERVYVCWDCRKEYETKPDFCENCGSNTFDARNGIEVDERKIHSRVYDIFSDFDADISKSNREVRLLSVEVDQEERGSSKYIRTTFRRAQEATSNEFRPIDEYRYEYVTYCLNGRKPQRIGQYLFDCVFITYGTAFDQEIDNFGTISLIDLLRSEEPEQLFIEAVEKSHRRRQDRYRWRAKSAVKNLKMLQSKVDNGVIEEYDSDSDGSEGDEFLDSYSAKKFEKDVFHLLKSVFLFTERWGKEGKKETDGLLVIPEGEDKHFVAGYDPKLTTDPKGYNLRSSEKNKAAYYILEESNRKYIKQILKDEEPVDAHIFISDIFRDGQFDTTAEKVREWFSLIEGNSNQSLDVPIVFISLSNLLKLYDIFASNYNRLREYPEIMEIYREEFVRQIRSSDGYLEFNEENYSEIEQRVIQELGQQRKDRNTQEYGDG